MYSHRGMDDAEKAAQRFFQVTGIALRHTLGVVHEKDKGRRIAFRLGKVEKFCPHALDYRGLMLAEHFLHGAVKQPGAYAYAALRMHL